MADTDPAYSDQDAYHELAYYTLVHPDPAFIHQYIVDAYAAQHADEHSKPISIAFALAGLSLHLERGYSGKQVQQAHMWLARKKQPWPRFTPPTDRGAITVADVLRAAPGASRDEAIRHWAASVWAAWSASHDQAGRCMGEGGAAAVTHQPSRGCSHEQQKYTVSHSHSAW